VDSAALQKGLTVGLGKGKARVLLIEPIEPAEPPVTAPRPDAVARDPKHHNCLDRRKTRFRLHRAPGARVVEVYAYINGRRVLHRKGHDLHAITLKHLPKGEFTVRIEVFQSTGSETVSVRRYHGCKKGAPHTHRGPGRKP
jgi:hypothetical protein